MATLINADSISQRIEELARAIAKDYSGKTLVTIGVLNGAYMLMADFTRSLWNAGKKDFIVDFVGVTSYGKSTTSSRKPRVTKGLGVSIALKHVLVVEDIVETGWSLEVIYQLLQKQNPLSVKSLALLVKSDKKEADISVDYSGFMVDRDTWVEGYGMDTAYLNRGCPEVLGR